MTITKNSDIIKTVKETQTNIRVATRTARKDKTMIKTLSYILGQEAELEIGRKYYFGQLWDGDGDGEELLESEAIAIYDNDDVEYIVDFKIVEKSSDILQTLVVVTGIN